MSDVDGTLLGDDHALPISPTGLRERLMRLQRTWGASVTVGLASSRTLRELTVLQRALGLYGPIIAEDGGIWATEVARRPANASSGTSNPTDANIENHGIRSIVSRQISDTSETLRDKMSDRSTFAQADTQQRPMAALRALGFRTPAAVRRALHARRHSVLVDPLAISADELEALRQISHDRGLQLRRGGRWFTLTSVSGKGPALCALRHQLDLDGVPPLVAAIGNEENDVSLLAEADLRFVIRNPHRGPHPVLAALPEAIVLDAEGPGGWMQMLDYLEQRATEAHS
ncbi:MAG: hypothetical protein IBJ03_19040 [Gemmatimonadaceae bacterium]|nr:hypothetical protein [Gemmatimonadaceae bacterium]